MGLRRSIILPSTMSVLLSAFSLGVPFVSAQSISYDAYADSVSGTATAVVDPNNAVGAPNGTTAQMAGTNPSFTLDMGSGEEGTQALRIHFGQINLLANVTVSFLDTAQGVIKSETRQLTVDPNPSTQNFAYNWDDFDKAYRFVRLTAATGGSANIDAIEALGYIGSTATQDTDGDGIPDRTEQQNGTNPLVADSSGGTPTPSSGSSPGGSSSTTNNTTNNTTNRTDTTTTGQVNTPPPASNDKDGDGMADDWELAHGLNPNDKNDATGDPDGDFLTNLGEYRYGSDPNKADDLKKLICGNKNEQWYLALAIILLISALAYLVKIREQQHNKQK